jgi:hypothetical protein
MSIQVKKSDLVIACGIVAVAIIGITAGFMSCQNATQINGTGTGKDMELAAAGS